MICPQLSAKAFACQLTLAGLPDPWVLRQRMRATTDLVYHVSDFLFDFLFSTQEPLPELVSNAAALKQVRQRMLRVPYHDDAVDIFYGAAQESGFEHAVRNLGLALLRFVVYEG
jgi:hypothetical protein